MNKTGVVELSSAVGYFWMRAYVFVGEHPYYTLTDAHGNFRLNHVPKGDYELVTWLPNWHVAEKEYDPEVFTISRLFFHSAAEQMRKVVVSSQQITNAEFTFSEKLFSRSPNRVEILAPPGVEVQITNP